MNDCGQVNWQMKTKDEVGVKVPDVEHFILLAEVSRRLGLGFHMSRRAKKTVSLRGRGSVIAGAMEETRLGTENAVAPLRSLVGVLEGSALRVSPTLLALLDRTKASLAVANNRSSHGADGAQIAGGQEDIE